MNFELHNETLILPITEKIKSIILLKIAIEYIITTLNYIFT